jgi:Carboxypeptidase regulatory-like domain/TonB-dependent Receptor Plug Domain
MKAKSLFLCLFLLALTIPVYAQTSSGSVAGSVVDSQQGVIANAPVTIVEQDKGTTFSTRTDAEGRFVFPQLLPGRYTVSVESPGFKKTDRKDIVLLANDKISAGTIVLEVGTVAESVEVSAQTLLLKTESAERSAALTEKELENIAVNSRSYLQLAGMLPGVVSTANLTTGGHAGLANISANGARFDQNNLTLNGIGNVDTGNNGDQLATISLDSVQEFKVLTSNYQAEYGRSSGAQISVVTKSGSSDFHGSGYLFHRHEGLNANNWKNNRDGLPRNLFRFNDPGYTIGGPVYIPKVFNRDKKKLFFFWSQEFQEQLKPQGRRDATFPTLLERAGDFSQTVDKNGALFNTIKDPLSSLPCNASNTGGCFNDGGVLGRIPKSRLYAPGVAALNFFPVPNNVSTANKGFNYSSQVPDSYPRREELIRGDYNISSKWRMFSHYLHNSDQVTSAYGSFVLGSGFPLVPITDKRPGYSFVVSATAALSATLTNEATWGFGKNIINIDPVNDGLTRTKTGINIPLLYPNAVQNDFIPRFAYAGTRIGNQQQFGTNNAPFYNYNATIEWIDNVTKVWGQHVLKAGIYIQRSRKDQTSFGNSSGDINFGDGSGNPYDTGFGFANMALGVYNTYSHASAYATGRYRYTNAEWYVQDQWKVTRRLTLDYGLRFQWIQPQFDAALQTSTFLPDKFDPKKAPRLYLPTVSGGVRSAVDPATGAIFPATYIGKIVNGSGDLLNGIFQADKGVSKYLIQNRGVHYAPRLGFAWDATGKQNMVVRGGVGMFYDRIQGNEVFDMITNPPTTFTPTLNNDFLANINPKNILLGPSGLNAFDYNGKVPTIYNYSLGIQTKLPYNLVLDTAYVGNLSRHQLQRTNFNAIPYGAAFLPQNQDASKGTSGLLGSNALDKPFLAPYQGYGDITVHQFGGTSNYNSLQTSLTRRFTKSLEFGVNYTWSRALGTSDDRGNFNRIDGNTRLANYALLGFHREHTMQIYYTYELPSLLKNNRTGHMLVDGWQISGNTTFQTGSPFTPGYSISGVNNQNITGSYTEGARLALIGQANTGSDNPYNRINPSAFAAPKVGSIGLDAPRNYLINPGINNWNVSLQKQFAYGEHMKLQLRADAFNVFNHTQFSGINSTLNISALTGGTFTNLYLKPDGTVNNINGFGTVNGARDPRIMQLGVRVAF